jgi:hypothetical protein
LHNEQLEDLFAVLEAFIVSLSDLAHEWLQLFSFLLFGNDAVLSVSSANLIKLDVCCEKFSNEQPRIASNISSSEFSEVISEQPIFEGKFSKPIGKVSGLIIPDESIADELMWYECDDRSIDKGGITSEEPI